MGCGGCGDELLTDGSSLVTDVEAQIELPPGFQISLWADDIIRPRSLALGDEGTVFVGSYFFTQVCSTRRHPPGAGESR